MALQTGTGPLASTPMPLGCARLGRHRDRIAHVSTPAFAFNLSLQVRELSPKNFFHAIFTADSDLTKPFVGGVTPIPEHLTNSLYSAMMSLIRTHSLLHIPDLFIQSYRFLNVAHSDRSATCDVFCKTLIGK